MFPDSHCGKAQEILRARSWPEEYVRAIASHGWGICNDVGPQTNLEKVLYATEELTGLITAVAIVRPSKSVQDLEVKSVMKKWKDRSFAAGVNRTVIETGSAMLGVELRDLIADAISGMREVADRIGL
jgi:predicted hydrolase (HD superfamily)